MIKVRALKTFIHNGDKVYKGEMFYISRAKRANLVGTGKVKELLIPENRQTK